MPFTTNVDTMFLTLLKRTLTGMVYEDPSIPVAWRPVSEYNLSQRINGRDWPLHAHTMVGLRRLDNLQSCIENVIDDDIDGDLIECGVWRGGASIFMRAMLKVYFVEDRTVWLADSFDGFPLDSEHEGDKKLVAQPDQAHLAIPQRDVEHNFQLYGLMDDQVKFIPGWFSKTLPGPVKKLAILRLDADLYVSTMDALRALYPLLEPGGFIIIDDWNVEMCRKAVETYRTAYDINELIIPIDGHSVYWRKDA